MDFEIKFIRNPGLRDDERDYLFFLEGLESGFDPHVFTECTVLLEARWDEFRVDSWAYGLRFLNGVMAFFLLYPMNDPCSTEICEREAAFYKEIGKNVRGWKRIGK